MTRRRVRRAVATVSLLFAPITMLTGLSVAAATSPVTFQAMPCPAHTFAARLEVRCGFIQVPENRADPHSRMITVAAAVVPSRAAHRRTDPIVFLNGGPSFGAISSFATQAYFAGAAFTKDRDVILVDTRGTGLATPRLGCPELDQAEVLAFYDPPTINSEARSVYSKAIAHCRNRLTAQGIDLAAYNSAESAADLDDLRQALGVPRWNLIAASADGLLGLTYMRLFPAGIRSAIIDSGQSTQMLLGLDYDRGLAEELDAVFAGCEANAACKATYPGLRHAFFETVRQLQQHPVTITFPDFLPHPVALRLDGGGLFADAIYSIFPGNKFAPNDIPNLIERLWRESHGELVEVYREGFGAGPVTNSHLNNDLAQGKTLSYQCHDSADFLTRADLEDAAKDLRPFASRYLSPDYDLGLGFTGPVSPIGCAIWDVGRADPAQHAAVHSAIPSLVLAGQFDGGVPPYIVRQTAVGLSRSHYIEFPASSHLQLSFPTSSSDCARLIADQFLAHPTASLDTSCVASLPPLDFTPGG